jgi:ubiquinone/menaquinone biosynthesis C-methylase UbiE
MTTRSLLLSTWGHPSGVAGRLAGWEMTFGKSATTELVAELLELCTDDRVLEVGFGPGVTLRDLAERVPEGVIAGVDPSGVMVRQAERRIRAARGREHAELHRARAESLPFPAQRFTKAFTLNSIGFWESVDDGLTELHRVLAPDALLLVGLRRPDQAAELARRLEPLGFDGPSIAERRAGRKAVTTIVARRGG